MGTDTRLKSIAEKMKEINIFSELCFIVLQCTVKTGWFERLLANWFIIKKHCSSFCALRMTTASEKEIWKIS
jgi:hypothetical protein